MPAFLAEWGRRVWYLLNRRRFDEALRRDMEAHRAMMKVPSEFGNTLRLAEESRDVWGWGWLDSTVRDIRFAARSLRRTPAFTIVAISSLALGLAVTASTLAVVNAYLVRSLPYPDASRLYAVRYAPPGPVEPRGMTSIDWTTLTDVVEHAATSAGETFYLMDRGYADTARGVRVSDGFLKSLGIQPILGRSFSAEEFHRGSEPVALIGYSLWREHFGSDPNVVGRMIHAYTDGRIGPVEATVHVIGVLPPVFWYQYDREGPDILVPLQAPARTYMVRLRAGVPVEYAEKRITDVARTVGSAFPPNWTGVHLESVHERYVAGLRPVLVAITVAASLVLVIVCANIAVLLLLRTLRRQKEIGVRLSLGAARSHIVCMLAAEACLLCGAAVVSGLLLTAFVLNVCAPFIEAEFGRAAPGGLSLAAVDPTVPLAIGILGVVIAVALSFIPLLPAWQRRLADALRRDGRSGTDSPSTRRAQSALIVFEVAGALALLVGCGLMIRSIINLVRTDLGFETARVVYAHLVLPRTMTDPSALLGFYDRLGEQVEAESGMPAALTDFIPFVETPSQNVEVAGSASDKPSAGVLAVTPGYFLTLGVTVTQGRGFTPVDRLASEPVVVISETLAKRIAPNQSAVGLRLRLTAPQTSPDQPASDAPWRTVVGVVRDVRQTYADTDLNDAYVPFTQTPGRFTSIYVRTDRPVTAWLTDLRRTIGRINPYVTVNAANALASEDRQLSGAKFLTALMSGFAAFAVLLALLGIYGVTAYTVQQREREVAIRMALGATGRMVVRMFLQQGGRVLGIGLAGGLIAATVVARLLEHQIHGVQPFDLSTFIMTAAVMMLAGLLATWWPARRAAARNPNDALNES